MTNNDTTKSDNSQPVTSSEKMPEHIAIIMDGNGRWAQQKGKPRYAGHKAGVEAVRDVVKQCSVKGIKVLTLFAFSSENWRRPEKEVGLLMELFMMALDREVKKLNENNVQLRIIGDKTAFNEKLQKRIEKSEALTADNTGLVLNIAANYGGQWDITQAVRKLAHKVEAGELKPDAITEHSIAAELNMADLPEPDLFIRTGGEQRISNFLIWQLAYTELYFTDVLWPDFKREQLNKAIESFAGRQRRFGRTGEQIEKANNA
ncbi:MAG: isoprenyl transferase [Thioalkalispiraceae bacterium]